MKTETSAHLKVMFASIKQRGGVAALALALAIALFSACATNGDSVNTGGGGTAPPIVNNSGESRIAFVASGDEGGDEGAEIFTMLPDGTDVKRLTNNQYPDWFPAWSPDGTRIAFTSFRHTGLGRGGYEIFTMSADGTDEKQVTNYQFSYESPPRPVWSPDGSRIAFSAQERAFQGDIDQFEDLEIFTVSTDGSDLKKLTINRSEDSSPSWSPDGSRIAFVSDRDGGEDIYTMSTDGSDVRRVTDYDAESPTWSPDGSRIAFVAQFISDSEIYTVSPDGSDVMKVLDLGQFAQFRLRPEFPSWSPDGVHIAFVSDSVGGRDQIYTMPANGSADASNVIRLTESGGNYPAWSPFLP